ncbi:ShK domain-like protein [Nitzschia inconspicua]|uniref:ShK domain-like protein n=1 Tax=Nitzschia inconspicua TaxID=303405 RepID=A0A9K3M5S2_9STRA|nr:ShK domain-like protein [Nitzschia inconspicua]
MKSSLFLVSMVVAITSTPGSARTEKERIQEFYRRNHTWPVEKFSPETPGWRKLFEHRLRQVAELEDRMDRFEGYAQTLSASVVQQNYTQWGFGLARAPEPLMEDLRQAIREGVAKGPRLESHINAITEPRPWFIDRPDLTQRVLEELQEYPEKWVGFPLTANNAYGFRLYRNQSRLHVHVDKAATHVISFILHIDSSDDAEPWPILIEDFQGNTHEVILTSGDILFYESSKCFHGRPRKFNGSWYSSVFVHYYPATGYRELGYGDNDNKVFAVPPGWDDEPTTKYEIPLTMHGTTMEEEWCPNHWCGTIMSKKWSGPGEEGWVIDPDGKRRVLDASKIDKSKMRAPGENPNCRDMEEKCAEWASWESNECETNAPFMKKNCQKSCRLCEAMLPTVYEYDEL